MRWQIILRGEKLSEIANFLLGWTHSDCEKDSLVAVNFWGHGPGCYIEIHWMSNRSLFVLLISAHLSLLLFLCVRSNRQVTRFRNVLWEPSLIHHSVKKAKWKKMNGRLDEPRTPTHPAHPSPASVWKWLRGRRISGTVAKNCGTKASDRSPFRNVSLRTN